MRVWNFGDAWDFGEIGSVCFPLLNVRDFFVIGDTILTMRKIIIVAKPRATTVKVEDMGVWASLAWNKSSRKLSVMMDEARQRPDHSAVQTKLSTLCSIARARELALRSLRFIP
jgi:hypothetical protein